MDGDVCDDSVGCGVSAIHLGLIIECGWLFFFFQAEDGIRDLVRSRGLGDVYKRQTFGSLK